MDKIDLDALLKEFVFEDEYGDDCITVNTAKECMRKLVHQALVLATEKAQLVGTCVHQAWRPDVSDDSVYVANSNGPDYIYRVDKQSILDIEKLII